MIDLGYAQILVVWRDDLGELANVIVEDMVAVKVTVAVRVKGVRVDRGHQRAFHYRTR